MTYTQVPTPSRFSDPRSRYAVLYASESVRCAFWEALGRNRFARRRRRKLPRTEVAARVVVSVRSDHPLALIDLRGDGPVRIRAPSAVVHDSNQTAGRALSAAIHATVQDADGFLFSSRFTGDNCVAVFERAFAGLQTIDVADLVRHRESIDDLDDYDILLTAPPMRSQ